MWFILFIFLTFSLLFFPVQINKNSRKWTLFSTNTNNKLLQVTFIWRVAPLYFACQELDFRGFWFQSNSPFEVKELIDCWAGNIPMRLTCPSYHKRVYLHSFLIIQDIANDISQVDNPTKPRATINKCFIISTYCNIWIPLHSKC